jgi:hypothetical protein
VKTIVQPTPLLFAIPNETAKIISADKLTLLSFLDYYFQRCA